MDVVTLDKGKVRDVFGIEVKLEFFEDGHRDEEGDNH